MTFKMQSDFTSKMKKLLGLNQPIAQIYAHHSSAIAKALDAGEFSGLEHIIYIVKGAKAMLTMNIWASVELCNGANGTIVDKFINVVNNLLYFLLQLLLNLSTTQDHFFKRKCPVVFQYVQSLFQLSLQINCMKGNNYL